MAKMTREEMDRILNEHFEFEARDDIDGVVNTLTEDVEHDVVGSRGSQITGRENARKYYESLFQDLSAESAKPVRRLYGDNFVVDETLWTGRASGRPFSVAGDQGRVTFRLLHILELRDGKISRENVWVDAAAIQQQLT